MNNSRRAFGFFAIAFFVLPICGCFFAHGVKYDQFALLHQSESPVESTIVVQAHPWSTGNGNIPFDFTVYREDFIYKITVPDTKGRFNGADMRLSICGRDLGEAELDVLAGQMFFDEKEVHFEIEYKFKKYPNDLEYISKIKAILSLVRSTNPVQQCPYHSSSVSQTAP